MWSQAGLACLCYCLSGVWAAAPQRKSPPTFVPSAKLSGMPCDVRHVRRNVQQNPRSIHCNTKGCSSQVQLAHRKPPRTARFSLQMMTSGRTHEKGGSSSNNGSIGGRSFAANGQRGDDGNNWGAGGVDGEETDVQREHNDQEQPSMTETLSVLAKLVRTTIPPPGENDRGGGIAQRLPQDQRKQKTKQPDWPSDFLPPPVAGNRRRFVVDQNESTRPERLSTAAGPDGRQKTAMEGSIRAALLSRLLGWSSSFLPWREAERPSASSSRGQERSRTVYTANPTESQQKADRKPGTPDPQQPSEIELPADGDLTKAQTDEVSTDNEQEAGFSSSLRVGWPWPWSGNLGGEGEMEEGKVHTTPTGQGAESPMETTARKASEKHEDAMVDAFESRLAPGTAMAMQRPNRPLVKATDMGSSDDEPENAIAWLKSATGKPLFVVGQSIGWAVGAAAAVVVPVVTKALSSMTNETQTHNDDVSAPPTSTATTRAISTDTGVSFDRKEVDPGDGISSAVGGATDSEFPPVPLVSGPLETISTSSSPALPRRALAWVNVNWAAPLSALGQPFCRSPSAGATAAADPLPASTRPRSASGASSASTSQPVSSTVSSPGSSPSSPPRLVLPPAAQALRERLGENPSFPVRSKWRPPGYRRAVSLVTSRTRRRNEASSRMVKNKAKGTNGDVGVDGRTPSALGAVMPSSAQKNLSPAVSKGVVRCVAPSDAEVKARGSMRVYLNTVTGVAAGLVNSIGRRLQKQRDQDAPEEENALEIPAATYNLPVAGNWAGPEMDEGQQSTDETSPSTAVDDAGADGDGNGLPWWQAGAAVVIGFGVGLARPIIGRLPGVLSSDPDDSIEGTDVERRQLKHSRQDWAEPEIGSSRGPDPAVTLNAPVASLAREIQRKQATTMTKKAEAIAGVSGQERSRDSRPLSGVNTLLDKAVTTSRRARLWLWLRRSSMARAEPLIPSVESAISSRSVPFAPPATETESGKVGIASATLMSGKRSTDGTGIERAAAEAAAMSGEAAIGNKDDIEGSVGGEMSAPQAVEGGGWNLFGFFPKDKGEERRENAEVIASDSMDKVESEQKGLKDATYGNPGDQKQTDAIYWPLSAWVDGYDPRAQVEAAMREALRSAFGYGSVGGASVVAPEALAAATAAAGDAAVAEATTANGQDAKGSSPTARYLDDLSPSNSTEGDVVDGRWRGAEAAAAAAAEAAGAAAGAAGAAAGVAAEVAAAAAAATLAVAAESLPFGTGRDDDMSTPGSGRWQVGGRWRIGREHDDDDDVGFGEGPLGVKPRKLVAEKAGDMALDLLSSAGLKRSVASDSAVQKQRPGYMGMFSAAVSRYSRLPRRWKSRPAETASAPAHVKDLDLEDMTLRRLGRVGVGQIASSMLLISSEIAQQVGNEEELEQFRAEGGMPRVLMALSPTPYTTKASGIAAIRNLLRVSPESVATEIMDTAGPEALVELRRLVGAPGEPWSAAAARAAAAATDSLDAMRLQAEAVELLQELSLASTEALAKVKELPNLIPALKAIAHPATGPLGRLRGRIGRSLGGVAGGVGGWERADAARRAEAAVAAAAVSGASKLLSMLGVHQWKPRQPGQKGLRILSLDGGGTRGVMSIALLREVMEGIDKDVHEVFDVICGTSTGGILAMLFAAEKQSLASASILYDELVVKIFRKDILGSANLVLRQALYSPTEWEEILYDILGDRRMIDISGDPDCPRVVICSTIINTIPLQMMLWRNYGYSEGQEPVYKGDYRRKMRECVRATTAAPSYFTPLSDGEILYADGAFMANNPTSIAITEAKLLYPDVPIECVLSVGTGFYAPKLSDSGMGWPTVVNQLINSATDTEGVAAMLKTFLPRDKYFRFNPSIEHFAIDEVRPEKLAELKAISKEYVKSPKIQARAKELRRILRGDEASFPWPGHGSSSSSDAGGHASSAENAAVVRGGGSDGEEATAPRLPSAPPDP